MAKRSLADLQAQIEKLQAEADQLREQEKSGVIARIREAIAAYELTERDLFGAVSGGAAPKRAGQPKGRTAAYSDGNGNVWGGRGPRPRWLREALQQGKSLQDFATPGRAPNAAARQGRNAADKRSDGNPPVKYRDDTGNSWSGRGPQPKWLKQAVADGNALESFRVGA